ncbi:MAG: hypothetical protein ACLFQO_12075 [Cyclobacteriaceae bacterium]
MQTPHIFTHSRLLAQLHYVIKLLSALRARPHRQLLAYLNTKSCRAFLQVLREVIVMVTALLKTSGLSERTQYLWIQRMQAYRSEQQLCQLTKKLAAIVDDYFASHAQRMARYGRLLCCSDIIECTFGRYKNKGGMKVISADVLAIALYGHKVSLSEVVTGLSSVSQKMVRQWHQRYTCEHRISTLRTLQKKAKARTAAA